MEPKNPLYRYRPLRPLKFYEDFLNVEKLITDSKGKSMANGDLCKVKKFNDFVAEHIKKTLPEWESYSPEMLRVINLRFRDTLSIDFMGETKHTKVLTFINGIIASFYTKVVLKDPNVFDLEFIKEMAILQQEAWPKLAS